MRIFIYFLLTCIVVPAYAESKIYAKYDATCDEKNEKFYKEKKLLISNRYKILSVLNLDKTRKIYILDRGFSLKKSEECRYSDPTIHSYVFVLQKGRASPYINEKILSNMNYISDISIEKSIRGFIISFVYGQSSTFKKMMHFEEVEGKGFFLKKVITEKVVPDGMNGNQTIQNLPLEMQYELTHVELYQFF